MHHNRDLESPKRDYRKIQTALGLAAQAGAPTEIRVK